VAKKNLGRILRRARKQQKRTLRELAARAGVSNAYLCQLEQSEDRLLQISWINFRRVSQAYGLDRAAFETHMLKAAQRAGHIEEDPT